MVFWITGDPDLSHPALMGGRNPTFRPLTPRGSVHDHESDRPQPAAPHPSDQPVAGLLGNFAEFCRQRGHHVLVTDDSYQVRRTQLEIPDANRLGKWASLWADLTQALMALHERSQLQSAPATAFTRRALWESAIISYGRMQTSGKKRRLEHEDLLHKARGDRGIEFHEILMSWRHGHVGHRNSEEFEAVRVFADHLDAAPDTLDSIRAEVVTSMGPPINSELETEFSAHVEALRNTLWEQYLAPIGEELAQRTPPGQPMTAAWSPDPEAAERLTLELTLWARTNGTGVGNHAPNTQ